MYFEKIPSDTLKINDDFIKDIVNSKNIEDIKLSADKIKKDTNVENITYAMLSGSVLASKIPNIFTTYSEEWQNLYHKNNFIKDDPTVKAAFHRALPTGWNEIKCETSREKRIMSAFREYELGEAGLILPLRGLRGEFGILTITGPSKNLVDNRSQYARLFSQVGTCLHEWFAQQAGLRTVTEIPKLSLRETQCLALYAEGYMGQKVAEKLKISEAAVRLYLTSARHKLLSQTTCGAVATAIRLGFI